MDFSRTILTLSGQTLPRAAFTLDEERIQSVLRASDPMAAAFAITRAAEDQDKKIGASEINAVAVTVLVDLAVGALILCLVAQSAATLPNFISVPLYALLAGLIVTLSIWIGIETSNYFTQDLKRAYRSALFTRFLWLRALEFVTATLAISIFFVSFDLFKISSLGSLGQIVNVSERVIGLAAIIWPDRLSPQEAYAEVFGKLFGIVVSSGIWWGILRYNNGFVRRPEKRST